TLTSSDASGTFTPAPSLSSGVGTFSATLVHQGPQTISAKDVVSTSVTATGSALVAVYGAAAATHFSIVRPSSAAAGSAFSITVVALDANNNAAIGYNGTVTITGSDSGAGHVYTGGTFSNGIGVFSETLVTAGPQTLTATDTTSTTIAGTSAPITVTAGVA